MQEAPAFPSVTSPSVAAPGRALCCHLVAPSSGRAQRSAGCGRALGAEPDCRAPPGALTALRRLPTLTCAGLGTVRLTAPQETLSGVPLSAGCCCCYLTLILGVKNGMCVFNLETEISPDGLIVAYRLFFTVDLF